MSKQDAFTWSGRMVIAWSGGWLFLAILIQ